MAGYCDVYIIALSLYEFMFIGCHLYSLPTCTQAVWAPGPTQGTAFGRPWASAGAETRPQSPRRLRLSAEAKDMRWSLGFREPVASGFRKCEDHHSLHLNGSQVEVCPFSIPTNYISHGGNWGWRSLRPFMASCNKCKYITGITNGVFHFFHPNMDLSWSIHRSAGSHLSRPLESAAQPHCLQRSWDDRNDMTTSWRHHDDFTGCLSQQSLRNRRSGWSRFNCRR